MERYQTKETPVAHSHCTQNFSFTAFIKTVPKCCKNYLFTVYLPTQVSKLLKSKNRICLVHQASLVMSTDSMNF